MTKNEALAIAFEELRGVQFIDNTIREANEARKEVAEIIERLADNLASTLPAQTETK